MNNMEKEYIKKNLKQIKQLLEEDSPYIAKERIGFLIDELEPKKVRQYRGRQGRSDKQYSDNLKVLALGCLGLGGILICMIIYGVISNG
jgi:hypothetical protein